MKIVMEKVDFPARNKAKVHPLLFTSRFTIRDQSLGQPRHQRRGGRVNNPLWMVSVHDRMLVTASFQHKINTSLSGFKPQMGPEMGVSEDGLFPQIGNFYRHNYDKPMYLGVPKYPK